MSAATASASIAEHVGDHDLGAFLGEEPRLGLAHAVRAAGDDRDFAVEAHGSLLVFALPVLRSILGGKPKQPREGMFR